ncbi:hypothetical protein DFP72DRAFT_1042480 [Ephemerocybe angulata]|uniref:Uncharacterized protein n=1 Tax=Ephemerocybe angulata TaxID=980116 RepID=A0A8H6I7N5_9AGAR|nr:hypothetical protein DFP72DRAFT_1042480 [Tulosesus angulatus]
MALTFDRYAGCCDVGGFWFAVPVQCILGGVAWNIIFRPGKVASKYSALHALRLKSRERTLDAPLNAFNPLLNPLFQSIPSFCHHNMEKRHKLRLYELGVPLDIVELAKECPTFPYTGRQELLGRKVEVREKIQARRCPDSTPTTWSNVIIKAVQKRSHLLTFIVARAASEVKVVLQLKKSVGVKEATSATRVSENRVPGNIGIRAPGTAEIHDVPDGLFYYTQSNTVVRVPRSRNEIRGLIAIRNALAGYMIKRVGREGEFNRKRNKEEEERKDIEEIGMGAKTFLPPPIDDEHACKSCYMLPMLESAPNTSNAPESLVDTYDLKTGHLTPEQGLVFRKRETLLSEERDLRRELWTIGAEDREKKWRYFAGMVVKPLTGVEHDAERDEKNAAGSKKWAPSSQGPSESDQRNLLNGHLNVGDPITVSVEPHLLAFAQGFITDLTPNAVKLGIDHKVDLEWIRARMRKDDPQFVAGEVVFRIDKDELFGGMGRMRNNLAQLFYANGDRKRLELVVDLRKPLFSPSIPPDSLAIESTFCQHVKNLNLSQKEAVIKVLSAEDWLRRRTGLKAETVEQVEAQWMAPPVVAATCLFE